MKIVDLHQDIVLSYEKDLTQFYAFDSHTYQDTYGTNVGSLSDYKTAKFHTVWGAARPYTIEGDLSSSSKTIKFDIMKQSTYIDAYNHLHQNQAINLVTSQSSFDNTKLNVLLHIEGIDSQITQQDIKDLYDKNVRSIGFVWNFDNYLSTCNLHEGGGLTELGKEIIKQMNYLGMIIDVAHMNHVSMMEVLEISKKPIINSHSNLKSFHSHKRNVYDDFLLQLAENGGMLGLSVCRSFIGDQGSTIDGYIDQVAYVRSLIGDDYIGFGSDYHGLTQDDIVTGLEKISSVPFLVEKMVHVFGRDFSEKFFYKNAERLIKQVLVK